MAWAKFDDRYDDNEKVKRAWKRSPAAAALHAHAITWSSRHETDGIVKAEWIQERFDIAHMKPKDRTEAIAALVESGLFRALDGESFEVNDYLKFNPSQAKLEEKRRKDSQRKRDGFHAESERSPNGVAAETVEPSERSPS